MIYIITLDEMKAELQLTDAEEDANLTLWMEGMQDRFDNRLGRKLLYGAEVETLDGGMDKVYLHRFPVADVDSVHCSVVGAFDDSSLLDPASEYRLLSRRGELLHGLEGADAWPEGHANVQVIYTGGFYASDAVAPPAGFEMPEDIRLAFLMQFSSLWKNRGNLGVTSKQKDGTTVQYGAGVLLSLKKMTMLADVEVILDRYMRFV